MPEPYVGAEWVPIPDPADPDQWRLVAVFPMNGRAVDAYAVYVADPKVADDRDCFIVREPDRFGGRLAGYHGQVFFPTIGSAIARCLRNAGWGDHTVTCEELT